MYLLKIMVQLNNRTEQTIFKHKELVTSTQLQECIDNKYRIYSIYNLTFLTFIINKSV